jgi:thiol-disulfide isomerase/thioredoxin
MRLVLAAVLTVLGALAAAHPAAADGPPQVPVFPNFAFTSIDGSQQIDLESLRGRPVLLTFWASWCGPCREELPELEKLAEELAGSGFTLITVNTDQSPAMGLRFLQRYDIDVPVYRMNPRDLMTLGVNALPTNVLLDREGRPVQIYKGYSPAVPSEIRQLVAKMGEAPAGGGGTSRP